MVVQVNIGRVGHYFTPSGGEDEVTGYPNGSCQKADVAGPSDVSKQNNPDIRVNLTVWKLNGEPLGNREDVPVAAPADDGGASFHLAGECPWQR